MSFERFKSIKTVYLGILIVALLSVWGYYNSLETHDMSTVSLYTDNEGIICNLESGFYNKDIEIKLSIDSLLPKGTEILYTTNGDDPAVSGEVYREPIEVCAEEQVKGLVLRAAVKYNNELSTPINRTFFVGTEIEQRYSYPVISIITDNENLFGYEKGLFIPGITYQNYLDEGGDPEADMTSVPCNYNRRGDEWVREAYLEVFAQDGTVLERQGIGMGITGSSSSGYDLKSLKLTANEIYDIDKPKFQGGFWRDYIGITRYSHNDKFNKIVLKSGGQDYTETQMRWDVVSNLAEQAGLYPVAGSKKVVVYINGEYYGLMSMSEDSSAYNIAKECGLEKERIEIIKGNEKACTKGIAELFEADLNNEANRQRLEAVVDIDQFMKYYAIQVLINNVDWPNNNYAMWRYTGGHIENNEFSDGKYRFLIYDVDLAYLPDEHWRKDIFGDEVLDKLLSQEKEGSTIFCNLVKSEYYREKFINVICDLSNTVFQTDNVLACFDKIYSEMSSEVYRYESSQYNKGENWIESFLKYWEGRCDNVRNAIVKRQDYLDTAMERNFGVDEKYLLKIQIPSESDIICNSLKLYGHDESSFSGYYYKDSIVKLLPKVRKGFSFLYWVINGEEIYEEELNITPELVTDSGVEIEIVLEKEDEKMDGLVINELSARGRLDWIELYNGADEGVMLDNYCLTDNLDNLSKYNCPSIYLPSGKTVAINGKSNSEMGAYLCNFNIRSGETVYLIHKETEMIVDSIEVPMMVEGESYGRYTEGDNWYFYLEPTKGSLNK